MDVVIFTGLQASGKTTFYRSYYCNTHVLVSKDLLRNRRKREAVQRRLIEEALSSGRSVVVDNCNVTVADRAPLLDLARVHGARAVGIYFESRITDCIRRNACRVGRSRVPDVAIYAKHRRLQAPSPYEGFDEVRAVRLVGDGDAVYTTTAYRFAASR
jgi:predicted kinase